jgi:two-component system sensor histidine kinase DegS
MAELRPPVLDELGLEGALRDCLGRFENEWHIATSLDSSLVDTQVDGGADVVVYRVLQEALTNVRKHAAATQVHVELSVTEGALKLRVRDNGSGFDVVAVEQSTATGHYGLWGMRQRIESANGTWQVTSAQGAGTTISATLPASSDDHCTP